MLTIILFRMHIYAITLVKSTRDKKGILIGLSYHGVHGLSKKFVQYVYKNFISQILGYINVVPFKIFPI